jgi:hypothetical protein
MRLGIYPLAFAAAVMLTCNPGAPARAQSVPKADTAQPESQQPRRPYRTLAERFDRANTTHDGHLTRAQAEGGMPRIAEHFDEIDTAGKGYVTLDQIRAYAAEYHRKRGDAPLRSSSAAAPTR